MSDRLNVRSLRVRKVHSLRTFLWLARGWKDFTSTPWVGVSHGLLMGLFGYGFGDHVLGQGGGGLQRGGNGLGSFCCIDNQRTGMAGIAAQAGVGLQRCSTRCLI